MSLVLNSISAGNVQATSGASTTTEGTTAAVPFAQALVQSMGGTTAKGAETPLPGNLVSLLQGLLNAVQTSAGEEAGNEETAKIAELLEGLTQEFDKLDESTNIDPDLLAALQGWLLQVSAVVSGGAADGSDMETGLSPLAQNPETLRFAVQDELNSLVGLMKQAAADGDEATSAKGFALLSSFKEIMAQIPVPDSKVKPKAVTSTEAPVVSTKQQVASENKVDARITVDMNKSVLSEEVAPDLTSATEEHEVVTAGQLSLRDGIASPLKVETSKVPVHQFAKEMSSFITGKLEIVQKGGVAEATITLFPEHLGQVDVKITMQNGHLVAQFLTEHAGAKDMLEQQMNQLRSALQSQGLQVEKLEVTQNNTAPQSQFNGQQGRQTGSNGQQSDGRSKQRDEDNGDAVLAAELNGEWRDWVASTQEDSLEQGGGFSAKV